MSNYFLLIFAYFEGGPTTCSAITKTVEVAGTLMDATWGRPMSSSGRHDDDDDDISKMGLRVLMKFCI